ncbi:MAG: hypothetical protein UC771_14480 [Faecalibacterium sp.]|nr:hypothetical protein [Faecalibacterium sp.]
MELMYKPGDKVMVRQDLNCSEIYRMRSGRYDGEYTYNAIDQMVDQAGEVFTIKGPRDGERGYTLNEIGYGWTDEMFISINECCCDSLL